MRVRGYCQGTASANASRLAPAQPLGCLQSAFSAHASAHAAQSFAFAICRTGLCRHFLLTYLIMDQPGALVAAGSR